MCASFSKEDSIRYYRGQIILKQNITIGDIIFVSTQAQFKIILGQITIRKWQTIRYPLWAHPPPPPQPLIRGCSVRKTNGILFKVEFDKNYAY